MGKVCLLCKHEDQNEVPSSHIKDSVLHACNSRAGGGTVEKGGVQELTGLVVETDW